MPLPDQPEYQVQFGKNLQKLRLEKGLSLRALAANCDLDDSNISKIEHGKLDVRLSTIVELAKGLGVEVGKLLELSINSESY